MYERYFFYTILVLTAYLNAASVVMAGDLNNLIGKTFSAAIVKLDINSNKAVFRDDKNICKSQGTGFLIGSNYVATAAHVYALDPECGERNILIKSSKYKIQMLGNVIASKNDVAILETNEAFPDKMCFLRLMAEDVYSENAIRFGIPGNFNEPPPPFQIIIAEKDSEFKPLTLITPVATEAGESGGPIIFQFNVVGITRAKHKEYPAFSFMTSGRNIRELVSENNIALQGKACNPADINMYDKNDINVRADIGLNNNFKNYSNILNGALSQISSKIIVSDMFSDVKPNVAIGNKNVSIDSNTSPPNDSPFNRSGPAVTGSSVGYNQSDIKGKNSIIIGNAAKEVERKFEIDLWQKYVEEMTKEDKWPK